MRARHPERLILAVPVGAPQTIRSLEREYDTVVALLRPDDLMAVGAWYEDFGETNKRTRAGGVMSKPTTEATQELMVDFITSLDGYGAAEGWPGWWGLEGPEYLGWLESGGTDFTVLMGAKTYELMAGMAQGAAAGEDFSDDESETMSGLAAMDKVVISSTLEPPYAWPNTTVLSGDLVELVTELKRDATSRSTRSAA